MGQVSSVFRIRPRRWQRLCYFFPFAKIRAIRCVEKKEKERLRGAVQIHDNQLRVSSCRQYFLSALIQSSKSKITCSTVTFCWTRRSKVNVYAGLGDYLTRFSHDFVYMLTLYDIFVGCNICHKNKKVCFQTFRRESPIVQDKLNAIIQWKLEPVLRSCDFVRDIPS